MRVKEKAYLFECGVVPKPNNTFFLSLDIWPPHTHVAGTGSDTHAVSQHMKMQGGIMNCSAEPIPDKSSGTESLKWLVKPYTSDVM